MAESDEKLMQRTCAGDRAALGELFDRHQPALHAFLTRLLGNATWAEDVTQEVFLRVWRYRHSFDPTQRFTAWLYGIARHTALTDARRPSRRELSLDYRSSGPGEAAREPQTVEFSAELIREVALREQVRGALQELPPEQRACLILREYEQHSFQEIAAILHCTPENARVLAFRARRALRALLAHCAQEEESCV